MSESNNLHGPAAQSSEEEEQRSFKEVRLLVTDKLDTQGAADDPLQLSAEQMKSALTVKEKSVSSVEDDACLKVEHAPARGGEDSNEHKSQSRTKQITIQTASADGDSVGTSVSYESSHNESEDEDQIGDATSKRKKKKSSNSKQQQITADMADAVPIIMKRMTTMKTSKEVGEGSSKINSPQESNNDLLSPTPAKNSSNLSSKQALKRTQTVGMSFAQKTNVRLAKIGWANAVSVVNRTIKYKDGRADLTDKFTMRCVISILTKQPDERKDEDLKLILPTIEASSINKREDGLFNEQPRQDQLKVGCKKHQVAPNKNQQIDPSQLLRQIGNTGKQKGNFDREQLLYISRQMKIEKASMGETVMRQGDFGQKFYIILQGRVTVIVRAPLQNKKRRCSYLPARAAALEHKFADRALRFAITSMDQSDEIDIMCQLDDAQNELKRTKTASDTYLNKESQLKSQHRKEHNNHEDGEDSFGEDDIDPERIYQTMGNTFKMMLNRKKSSNVQRKASMAQAANVFSKLVSMKSKILKQAKQVKRAHGELRRVETVMTVRPKHLKEICMTQDIGSLLFSCDTHDHEEKHKKEKGQQDHKHDHQHNDGHGHDHSHAHKDGGQGHEKEHKHAAGDHHDHAHKKDGHNHGHNGDDGKKLTWQKYLKNRLLFVDYKISSYRGSLNIRKIELHISSVVKILHQALDPAMCIRKEYAFEYDQRLTPKLMNFFVSHVISHEQLVRYNDFLGLNLEPQQYFKTRLLSHRVQFQKFHYDYKYMSIQEIQWHWLHILHNVKIFELDSVFIVCLQLLFFIYHPVDKPEIDTQMVNEITYMTQVELLSLILHEFYLLDDNEHMHDRDKSECGSSASGEDDDVDDSEDRRKEQAQRRLQQKLDHKKFNASEFESKMKAMVHFALHLDDATYKIFTIAQGGSFGEKALLNNTARAASILCATDCYFGVLERNAFQQSVGKLKQANQDKQINFLKSIPAFSGQSRGALLRLLPELRAEYFTRGQMVFKQGTQCSKIYIVLDGEFQAEIVTQHEHSLPFPHQAFTGPKAMRTKSTANAMKEHHKEANHLRVGIYTRGMMLGDDDIISMNPHKNRCCKHSKAKVDAEIKLPNHSKSVKCISLGGQLLAIDMAEVKSNRIKFHEEVWDMIEQRAKQRKQFEKRADQTSQTMKFASMNDRGHQDVPKHLKFTGNDFFEMNFSGYYLPDSKMDRCIERIRGKPSEVAEKNKQDSKQSEVIDQDYMTDKYGFRAGQVHKLMHPPGVSGDAISRSPLKRTIEIDFANYRPNSVITGQVAQTFDNSKLKRLRLDPRVPSASSCMRSKTISWKHVFEKTAQSIGLGTESHKTHNNWASIHGRTTQISSTGDNNHILSFACTTKQNSVVESPDKRSDQDAPHSGALSSQLGVRGSHVHNRTRTTLLGARSVVNQRHKAVPQPIMGNTIEMQINGKEKIPVSRTMLPAQVRASRATDGRLSTGPTPPNLDKITTEVNQLMSFERQYNNLMVAPQVLSTRQSAVLRTQASHEEKQGFYTVKQSKESNLMAPMPILIQNRKTNMDITKHLTTRYVRGHSAAAVGSRSTAANPKGKMHKALKPQNFLKFVSSGVQRELQQNIQTLQSASGTGQVRSPNMTSCSNRSSKRN